MVIFDINTAFGSIWHQTAYKKLLTNGPHLSRISWFGSILSVCFVVIWVNGFLFVPRPLSFCLPRDSVLSQFFFRPYGAISNDIHSYVDCTVIHSPTNMTSYTTPTQNLGTQQTHSMNKDHERILQWEFVNLVSFSNKKTQALLAMEETSSHHSHLNINGTQLELAEALTLTNYLF